MSTIQEPAGEAEERGSEAPAADRPAEADVPSGKEPITINELVTGALDTRLGPQPASSSPRAERAMADLGRTTLHRLHCFQVVVEEAGFKRATARLHLTQPALSYQIKQLEADLGSQLFFRRPGGVYPTEAGRLLYEHTQRIAALLRRAHAAMKELSEGAAGELRIGAVNSVGTYFLPKLLWAMRERYPTTQLTVLYRDASDIVDTLLANQLDMAILANPKIDRRLRYEVLFEEPISLVAGRSHPFFGAASVSTKRLRTAQFVSLSDETPTGALVAGYLERLGITTDPVVSTENVETVKRMVQIGMGIALLPDMVTERDIASPDNPEGRLSRTPLHPPLARHITLVTWTEIPASRTALAFVEEARRHAATLMAGARASASTPAPACPFAAPASD